MTIVPHGPRALFVSLAAWHLACLAAMYVYGFVLAPLVLDAYTALFGEHLASYQRFIWVDKLTWMLVVPFPANLIALRLLDLQLDRRPTWKSAWLVILAWQLAVIAALVLSDWINLPSVIRDVYWVFFGPIENPYGVRSFLVPRLIPWQISTTPLAIAALSGYGASARSLSLRGALFWLTAFAVALALIRADECWACRLVGYCVGITVAAASLRRVAMSV